MKVDYSNVEKVDLSILQTRIEDIHNKLHRYEIGSDYSGWLELPIKYDKEEYMRLLDAAKKIRDNSQVLVVIGIGGSYLGAKAGLEFLNTPFEKRDLEIIFAGHHMNGEYLSELINYLKDKDYSICVISKSGTTTEPAIAFRILKNDLELKYKEEAKKRIYAITDKARGGLYKLSLQNGYERFVIPDNVGGRFSVLTPVGLLVFAAAGYDTNKILEGAKEAFNDLNTSNNNPAYQYAAIRHILEQRGYQVELFSSFEPNLVYFAEWWKQLFGESEGKEGRGLFVGAVNFTTDLHSMGQYIQEGKRILFETTLKINKHRKDFSVPSSSVDLDELNYIANKTVDYVNSKALLGTIQAHVDGGVPNILIEIDEVSEKQLGYMFYFFEKACAMSAYLLGVNPFNQPGVEAYKKNMFKLLGKK